MSVNMLWLLLLAPFIDMCICLFLVYNILKVYQILLLDILYLITCDKPSSPLSLHQESSFNTPCSSCLFRFSSIVGGIFSSASYNWARVVGFIVEGSVFGDPGRNDNPSGEDRYVPTALSLMSILVSFVLLSGGDGVPSRR